jgi:hypothetical protein
MPNINPVKHPTQKNPVFSFFISKNPDTIAIIEHVIRDNQSAQISDVGLIT